MAEAKIIAKGEISTVPKIKFGKILIIEDNRDLLEILNDSFQASGFEVLKTPYGKEGIELAKREIPNAIILDILLDDMDGFEVLTTLRETLETRLIPVVVYTNLQSTTDKMAGIRLGADAYYQKTEMPPLELAKKTKELLQSS